jgi:DNA-binding response OmpR family regulator/anti-sigma regulatory factor (Ser/Thr protein kinase)
MKKILVIDDAEFILESTSTLLRFEGYDIYTAVDGEDGVHAAVKNKPDLILCDISMPKLDGYEVLAKVRSNLDMATTPFIFLTAFTEKSNMRRGMEQGADDFLVKPYNREELIAAIDAQWSKHSRFEKQVQEKVDEVGRNVTYALPHEFRTVLNEVSGLAKYMNTVAENISPEEIKETSADILASAERLSRITENFLAYIRIESFASNPEKRLQLRNYLTEEPAAMLNDIAFSKAEKFKRENDLIVEGEIDHIAVEISTENFHKIIDELLDNSFRFSDPGTQVVIGFDIDKNMLAISITDNGRGMTDEQISNIAALSQFERTIYEQQGVGMGLIISKRLVEIHDGLFEIESKESIGTTVRFYLNYITT